MSVAKGRHRSAKNRAVGGGVGRKTSLREHPSPKEGSVPLAPGACGLEKGATMGKMAEEAVEIGPDTLDAYLRSNTRVFAKVGEYTYYVTHTDGYWRIQDCANLNEKGHFSDCSDLVPTVNEVINLPFHNGRTLLELACEAEFFPSIEE